MSAIISKISLKTVNAQPKAHSIKARTNLCEIYGSARKFSHGSSSFGMFVKFHGDFEAVNCETGETFRSSSLLLPELAQDLLVSALKAGGATPGKLKSDENKAVEGEEVSNAVDFAFRIIAVPAPEGKPGGMGFSYALEPIVEPTGADPLAALRDRVDPVKYNKEAVQKALPLENGTHTSGIARDAVDDKKHAKK